MKGVRSHLERGGANYLVVSEPQPQKPSLDEFSSKGMYWNDVATELIGRLENQAWAKTDWASEESVQQIQLDSLRRYRCLRE